jgi:tungstate transport system substrate-binding protein
VRRLLPLLGLGLLALACGRRASGRADAVVRLAAEATLCDTGLPAQLVAGFEKGGRYRVDLRSVPSEKALDLLRAGEVDAALTDIPGAELAALGEGFVGGRAPVLHDTLVLIGPRAGAGTVAGATDAGDALRRVAASGRRFIARADGSGTAIAEAALWRAAGVVPGAFRVEVKAGARATLKRAGRDWAFALIDRATFILRRDDTSLVILFAGDPRLAHVYSLLTPRPSGQVNVGGADALRAYLLSAEARGLIGAFGVRSAGEPLFAPGE